MKSVLISIRPKWCEQIASGKKTNEVRKTKPKLDVPFKAYIYCTQNTPYNPVIPMRYEKEGGNIYTGGKRYAEFLTAKVIGEFVCDFIAQYDWLELDDDCEEYEDVQMACLSSKEILDYLGEGKYLYFWHISNLVIYDKPRSLGEFYTKCKAMACEGCEHLKYQQVNSDERDYDCEYLNGKIPLSRPPQSWCYVEEPM